MTKGLSFPIRFSPLGHLATSSDSEHTRDKLVFVITTVLGERTFQPDIGTEMGLQILRPNDQTLASLVEQSLEVAISRSQLRVRVTRISVVSTENRIRASVSYAEAEDGFSLVRTIDVEV